MLLPLRSHLFDFLKEVNKGLILLFVWVGLNNLFNNLFDFTEFCIVHYYEEASHSAHILPLVFICEEVVFLILIEKCWEFELVSRFILRTEFEAAWNHKLVFVILLDWKFFFFHIDLGFKLFLALITYSVFKLIDDYFGQLFCAKIAWFYLFPRNLSLLPLRGHDYQDPIRIKSS